MNPPPDIRVTAANGRPLNPQGSYVLYWMTAFRRTGWNFGLQRAVWWARELGKPLLLFEGLRAGYRWASDRLHRFVIEGMADNQAVCDEAGVAYYPYLEPSPGAGKGLLSALAEPACTVVTDDCPAFFLRRMVRAAAPRVPVCFETVDSNGLLPLGAADRVFGRAFDFRRFLQANLLRHLAEMPEPEPLTHLPKTRRARVPAAATRRWPPATPALLSGADGELAGFPIDHSVRPASTRGGPSAARAALDRFLGERLPRYAELRNHPDEDASSGLSPYLHFGHVSAHQVFAELMLREGWTEDLVSGRASGSRSGWWRVSPSAEAFLDQLITWRELGFNLAHHREDGDRYESLPEWARATLGRHASDPRPHCYDLAGFEAADTHDKLWNAAQRQLVREGRLHNYLRMLWGKKILDWSRAPEEALATMIELNDKYALDGRDPNSTSGITWCLGRYDRPWGPERPIFGTVRYMSSENTARKVRVREYLRTYGR